MADVSTHDPERGAAVAGPRTGAGARSRPVRVAAGGPDERPALWAIVVGLALLAAVLIWFAVRDDDSSTEAAATAGEPATQGVDEGDGVDAGAGSDGADAGLDIPALQELLDSSGLPGLVASADGDTLVLTGEVPDESVRNIVIDVMSVQPGVTDVDATGLVAP